MRLSPFFAVALLLLLPFASDSKAQNANAMATVSYIQNGFSPAILDAGLSRAERLRAFAGLIALANQGQVRAQDLAGTLYWQGPAVANSPVETSLEQARILLGNASVHGHVPAMAKIAELELQDGKLTQAMVWAQMYTHYLDPLKSPREQHGPRYAYAADLIHRIGKAGGELDEEVSQSVTGMVTRFDRSIRAGITAFEKEARSGQVRLVSRPQGNVPQELRNKGGRAEYMVEFDPAGAPLRVWPIVAWPWAELGPGLQAMVDNARVNTASADTGPRYFLVTIPNISNKARQLRPHR